MHIKDIDLNLLRLFDAVCRTRNVSRAADALDITQLAVGRARRPWNLLKNAIRDVPSPCGWCICELAARSLPR